MKCHQDIAKPLKKQEQKRQELIKGFKIMVVIVCLIVVLKSFALTCILHVLHHSGIMAFIETLKKKLVTVICNIGKFLLLVKVICVNNALQFLSVQV